MATRVLLASLLSHAAAWSWRSELAGEWNLERTRGAVVTRAHYSLNETSDGSLEGTYHEEGAAGEMTNNMRVRVLFDDDAGHTGSFQLAKVKQPEAWEDGEDPEPVPVQQPEPRTVFKFALTPQLDERYWISESTWLVGSGGKVQLVVTHDSFVISQFTISAASEGGTPSVSVSTFTALRSGAPPRKAGSKAKDPNRKSMLQKWGPYLTLGLMYLGYKATKQGGK